MSEDRLTALEARLKELEDLRAIEDLFYKWHHDCTGGFVGKQAGRMEALECLTEDATIEILGLHEIGKGPRGREEYTEFWEYYYGDNGPLPYVFQTSVADKITIDGDTALHKTNMLGVFQVRGEDGLERPWLSLSQRTNDVVRTPEGWRIARTTMDGGFSVPLEGLQGPLNKLPEVMEKRIEWKYKG